MWSEKITTHLSPECRGFRQRATLGGDPVTGANVLGFVKSKGPREQLERCEIKLFNGTLIAFAVLEGGRSMKPHGLEDLYPGIVLVDVTGEPGKATLKIVTSEIKLPAYGTMPLESFLTAVLEKRLGEWYPPARGIRLG